MDDIKPWYLSKTIWGGLVAIAASVGSLLGVPVEPGDQAALSDAIITTVGAAGAVLTVVGRIAATSRIF
ncbi:hypothetical protein [Pararhizobium haloflavum]|uniref:hypothetical protein n=1 Tax=Pararhizobium haloflavum TaxID=2037914 RepID=UPI000C175D03|nr:hypothetical protein [Pararhizobium haloflavum]